MKYSKIFFIAGSLTVIIYSCSKSSLDQRPLGQLDPSALSNKDGVAGLLIGAYSLLDGVGSPNSAQPWESAGSNWSYGSVCGSEAHKGSILSDQPDLQSLEIFTPTASNEWLAGKWGAVYDGIGRCNDVLRVMRNVTGWKREDTIEIKAEVLFLRAHYHFEAKKIWGQIPFIDETITYDAGNYKVGNEIDAWPRIEDDLQFAADSLPVSQEQIGRATRFTAKALLAKAYLFQHKYDSAKMLLDEIIASGNYALGNYADNFNPALQNNKEYIFAAQNSANDGSLGANANFGEVLNFPIGGPATCCGFFQPSQFLVNHFVTDPVTGLPNLDEDNLTELKNDRGLFTTDPFFPDSVITLDPRLDWTVGRRGIPYLDWGLHPGQAWIVEQSSGGPYSPIKNTYYKSQQGTYSDVGSWSTGLSANNTNLIRYADVLLWAAEAEVQSQNGSLEKARGFVNEVRKRAADSTGWVYKYKDDGNPLKGFSNIPAAHYFIRPYTAVWTDPVYALKAIRYERMLELGMEGHRFFDLVRWGIAKDRINNYLAKEKSISGYLAGAVFTDGKNEYFPIPQTEIDRSDHKLKQNPGY